MSCYHPKKGWQLLDFPVKGESKIIFGSPLLSPSVSRVPIVIPCGSCIGCRDDRARMWAIRCMHESLVHDDSCFVTLTYRNEDLPIKSSLRPRDFVNFMKRFRKAIYPIRIRFFHCGEYGEKFNRPHHHVIIFGYRFKDLVLLNSNTSMPLYKSDFLGSLWKYGFSSVGNVTFDSCKYVARYILKKITGDIAPDHYQGRVAEYITMSRKPGIGSPWYDKFSSDVFPCDNVVVEGRLYKVPRYYDSKLESYNPALFNKLKSERVARAELRQDEQTRPRLRAAEAVKRSQLCLVKRGFENGD